MCIISGPLNPRDEAILNCINSRPYRITLLVISVITLLGAITAFVLGAHFNFPSPLLHDVIINTGGCLTCVGVFPLIVLSITNFTRRARDFAPQGDIIREQREIIIPEEVLVEQNYHYEQNEEKIHLTVVQTDVKQRPEFHLDQLSTMIFIQILQRATPQLHVRFHGQEGQDAGGLTKIYLDDLMQALVTKEELFTKNEMSLYAMPKSTTAEQDTIFRQLGQLMMFCYPNLPLGRYIDPLVFEMALSMDADEIDLEYNELQRPRKLDLFKFIVESRLDPEIAAQNRLLSFDQQTLDTDQRCLHMLGENPNEWTEQECMEVGAVATLPEGYCDD